MNQAIAWISRPIWRVTMPLRRAFLSRFDAHVSELVAGTVNARIMPQLVEALANCLQRLERIEGSLGRVDRTASTMAEEVDLVLNGLSREIFRLQAQLEVFQRAMNHEAATVGSGLSIVAEASEEVPTRRPSNSAERARVG